MLAVSAPSIFNHRTDEYGGNARNRARFATEAVQAIRKRLPDLPIDYNWLSVRKIRTMEMPVCLNLSLESLFLCWKTPV